MPKNNKTIEKIDEIVSKISENVSKKGLSENETQKILLEVSKSLVEVKENAEDKYEKMVEDEVKELKQKISKSLDNEDEWGEAKILLKNDIKSGLERLKNEIIELEKPVAAIPVIVEHEPGESVIHRDIKESEELAKWRNLFPKQTPEEAVESLKQLASAIEKERIDHKEELGKIQKELEKANTSEEIIKISQNVTQMADKYVSDIGQRALPVLGPLVGAGFGLVHGVVEVGVFAGDKAMNRLDDARKDLKDLAENAGGGAVDLAKEGMKYFDKSREGLKEFAEKNVEVGAGALEKFRQGAENLAGKGMENLEKARQGAENLIGKGMDDVEKVIEKNLDVAQKAVEGGVGAEFGGVKIGINMGRGNVLEAKVEGKEEKIALLEKELEVKNQELGKKDERIKELEQAQTGQQKDQNQLLLDVVKSVSRPSSPTFEAGNEKEINRLKEELDEKKQKIKKLKDKSKGLKQEIKNLKNSQQTAQIEVPTKQ